MARVLAVGIATLDIINSVDGYPGEDDEVRASDQRVCRGGNATNTLVVLSQLQHHCSWAGVLVNEPDAVPILTDLERHGINIDNVTKLPQGKVPTSYVTQNLRNGSRTIVHYRDLPEYSYMDFCTLDLNRYDWLHFEGRNVHECERMMLRARETRPDLPLSLEVEKERTDIDELFPLAQVILFSRNFALGRGYNKPAEFLKAMHGQARESRLFCAWGEEGAYGLSPGGRRYHSPAVPPVRVVDTLGAGDTFNAGIIDACLNRKGMADALAGACRLAGHKCGHMGLNFITSKGKS